MTHTRMSNKYLIYLIGLFGMLPAVNAQVLTAEQHMPNRTDSLFLYKLPAFDFSGNNGNEIWDFSSLVVDNAPQVSADFFPSSETESFGLHQEKVNFYYCLVSDTLYLKGYESSHKRVRFSAPVPLLAFPFACGDSLVRHYRGEGQYCHQIPFSIEGTSVATIDTTGQLLLPDNITIDSALRVHFFTEHTESLQQTIMRTDRYQWYSPYSRYPLLESVTESSIKGQDTTLIACAYYYPPEQADLEHIHQMRQIQEDTIIELLDSLITDVQYMPNPVYTALEVTYHLARAAHVYISLHYNGGAMTYQTPIRWEEDGAHSTSINMSGMQVGTYVVYIHADDQVISGNIIKL